MFEKLELISADTILGLMAAYRADPDPSKVDLGVRVVRDDRGETPVLGCVRTAEAALLAEQTTKTYVGPTGNAGFNQEMEQILTIPMQSRIYSGSSTRSKEPLAF